MKKLMMMALAMTALSVPAFAADSMMHKDQKAQMKTEMAMKKMDANGDGMVSKEEYTAAMDKKFADADTNSDGSLSVDEIKSAKKKEMDEMKAMKPESK